MPGLKGIWLAFFYVANLKIFFYSSLLTTKKIGGDSSKGKMEVDDDDDEDEDDDEEEAPAPKTPAKTVAVKVTNNISCCLLVNLQLNHELHCLLQAVEDDDDEDDSDDDEDEAPAAKKPAIPAAKTPVAAKPAGTKTPAKAAATPTTKPATAAKTPVTAKAATPAPVKPAVVKVRGPISLLEVQRSAWIQASGRRKCHILRLGSRVITAQVYFCHPVSFGAVAETC